MTFVLAKVRRSWSGTRSLEESIVAQWEAETRTFVPNWRFEDGSIVLGNPRAGEAMTSKALPLYNIPRRWVGFWEAHLRLSTFLA